MKRFEGVQSGLQELGIDFVHNTRLVRGLVRSESMNQVRVMHPIE